MKDGNAWARLPQSFMTGRQAFVAMLTAALNEEPAVVAQIMMSLDRETMGGALAVALGTGAANVVTACEHIGMSVDDYLANLGLAAAQDGAA